MDEMLTWSKLGTITGIASAVSVVAEMLKKYLPNIDPKWIALAVSAIFTFGHQIIVADLDPMSFVLSVFKVIVATWIATGEYEAIIKPIAGYFDNRSEKRDSASANHKNGGN